MQDQENQARTMKDLKRAQNRARLKELTRSRNTSPAARDWTLDKKETTLTLLPSTIKFFFKTVMKEGELTKEGREELAEKYHLEAKQFEKIKAPKLDDTALFRLGDKEFKNSRAGRLVSIHNRLYIKPNTHI